jgi:FtsP/CotA-like multicopper oxidase with cupredoxin domain
MSQKNTIIHFVIFFIAILLIGCKEQIEKPHLESQELSRDISILPLAKKSDIVILSDNEVLKLSAMPVIKEIAGRKIRMFGYNGEIPGPIIKVKQKSTVLINFTNNIELPTTVHWHGIRLENRYDGVPDITQKPVFTGESFLYKLTFPDEGVYWYHPHIREDIQQELGLYGNIIVEPISEDYYDKVDKEEFLFLDDIRLAKNDVDTYGKDFARFALMGRFGNILLINGETEYNLTVKRGDLVRFYLTNSANTRVFNFSIGWKKLRIIGGDSGRFEHEEIKDSIVLSPAERNIIEVLFDTEGEFRLLHKAWGKEYELGRINVLQSNLSIVNHKSFSPRNFYSLLYLRVLRGDARGSAYEHLQQESSLKTFLVGDNITSEYNLKSNSEIVNSIEKLRIYFNKEPDYDLVLTMEMQNMEGMKHNMQDSSDSIEWEDNMPSMNAMSSSKNTRWIIKDKKTGKENMDIDYTVKVGDVKKIRIFNEANSFHPMHHPIHLHGQRFLVLAINDKPNENIGWKDTVLVPKGAKVDILIEFTNPGKWMIHCHIAEHLESGMMAMFTVE